jgi:hypothetical protein
MQFCVAMTALLLLLLPQRSPRACTPSVGLHSPFSAQRALSAVVVPEPACGASCKKHQLSAHERTVGNIDVDDDFERNLDALCCFVSTQYLHHVHWKKGLKQIVTISVQNSAGFRWYGRRAKQCAVIMAWHTDVQCHSTPERPDS